MLSLRLLVPEKPNIDLKYFRNSLWEGTVESENFSPFYLNIKTRQSSKSRIEPYILIHKTRRTKYILLAFAHKV